MRLLKATAHIPDISSEMEDEIHRQSRKMEDVIATAALYDTITNEKFPQELLIEPPENWMAASIYLATIGENAEAQIMSAQNAGERNIMDIILKLKETEAYIRLKTNIVPEIGVILGSGLGTLADHSNELGRTCGALPTNNFLIEETAFSFNELPHFVSSTVDGHAGKLIIGSLSGKNIAVLQGRLHYYEGYNMAQVIYPVRLLKTLGVKRIIITSACGALNPLYKLHDIILLKDHINLMGVNPLRGEHHLQFGARFPDMSEVYSSGLRSKAKKAADRDKIRVKEGVYLAVSGPNYETPAEIKAYRKLGGDLIGMSVVPEAVAAKQMGMEILGISYVSNTTKKSVGKPLVHEDVIKAGKAVSEKIGKIIADVIEGV